MEEGKIITLGDSHCVLVEFEPYAEEKYIRNAVREIMGFGYQPVIAHVERYRNLMERKFAAIQWMREIGALIQVKCAELLRRKYGDIYAAELTGGNARRFLAHN